MHIGINHEEGRVTLEASNEEEAGQLRSIYEKLSPSLPLLGYGGKHDAEDGRIAYLIFKFPDGQPFTLTPTDEEDKDNIGRLRDSIYWGGGGLLLREKVGEEGQNFAVRFTITQCIQCGRDITKRSEAEWEICASCKAVCVHDWKQGYVHGGRAGDLSIGQYCTKCGVGNQEVPLVETFEPGWHVLGDPEAALPN